MSTACKMLQGITKCMTYSFNVLRAGLNIHSVRQLILLIGNYMNGTGVKGGAYGFRVSSINKVNVRRHDRNLLTAFLLSAC